MHWGCFVFKASLWQCGEWLINPICLSAAILKRQQFKREENEIGMHVRVSQ